jgi:hypothetical protein
MAAIAESREPEKSPPQQVKRNPCAEFGPGFVMVEGTSTCVKIGGSVGAGAGSRPLR